MSGVAAADPGDGRLGGPPSETTQTTLCPGGRAVTGVTGKIGAIGVNPVVATATAQCAGGATADGEIGSSAAFPERPTGATACAAGQVAVGIVGREGDFVDQLAVRCRASDLSGPITTAEPFGGGGGGPDGPYDCPPGQVLVGLAGSVVFDDTHVGHLEIRCAPPPAETPPPGGDDPPPGDTSPPGEPVPPEGTAPPPGIPPGPVPPETTIKKHPPKETEKRRAKFTFVSDPPGGASFECKLDRERFKRCASPVKVKVGTGRHKFSVRATIEGLTDPTPAKFKWKVLED